MVLEGYPGLIRKVVRFFGIVSIDSWPQLKMLFIQGLLMLRTNQSEPLYWQLFARLRQDIEKGILPLGECLPSERKLAAYHGISRLTVRKALQLLIQQGYARAERGRGTFVALSFPCDSQSCYKSFADYIQMMGVPVSTQLLRKETLLAEDCPLVLPCAPDADLIFVQMLHCGNGIPLALVTSYWSHAIFHSICARSMTQASFFTLIAQTLGTTDLRIQQVIRTLLASEEEMRLMALKAPIALLQLQRIFYGPDEQFLCYAHAMYRGDRCYLDFT